MAETDGVNLRREALMLGAVLVVAFVSPIFFDQPPLNWISVLFVGLYVAQRAGHASTRHGTRVRG